MTTHELAQQILDLIESAEQEGAQAIQACQPDDLDGRIQQGIVRVVMLKAKIKELCQEQVQKAEE